MAREKRGGHDEGGGGGHGDDDRPWVYFMIDSFFLCTQFFVVTFKVKSDEVVLPQRLPPGGTSPAKNVAVDTKKKLAVHVMNVNGQPMFHFMTQQLDLNGFTNMLATSVSAGQDYQVRASYEPDVQFKDVMAIFNACAKQKISECGLIPLRGRDAVQ